ncbi:OST-HTH/LOTUS domain-containing protein [Alishewanella tabrizica]|nr:OST-HTH/LOTUS domain-containing protein [Alishewanella tabrizica]
MDEVPEATTSKPQTKPTDGKRSKRDLCCDTRLINILRNSVRDNADEDGWANMGACGALIKRQYPDFDARTYGYPTFTKLYEATELFDIDKRKSGSARLLDVYVRDKRN